jgi:uncharacterized protein
MHGSPSLRANGEAIHFKKIWYMKVTSAITNQIISAIRHQLPNIQAIYIFGSFAAGTAGVYSDIDIAILPAKALHNALARWKLSRDIALLIKRDVDLIDLRQVSTVMRFQIISTGVCIYSQDIHAQDMFEDFVYSSYLRFNEERKGILTDIQQRGRIYGQ